MKQKTPSNSAEYFLNKSKTNPLDKLPASIAKNFNKYDAEDGQNIVVGANGQLMTEQELKQQKKYLLGTCLTGMLSKKYQKKTQLK